MRQAESFLWVRKQDNPKPIMCLFHPGDIGRRDAGVAEFPRLQNLLPDLIGASNDVRPFDRHGWPGAAGRAAPSLRQSALDAVGLDQPPLHPLGRPLHGRQAGVAIDGDGGQTHGSSLANLSTTLPMMLDAEPSCSRVTAWRRVSSGTRYWMAIDSRTAASRAIAS